MLKNVEKSITFFCLKKVIKGKLKKVEEGKKVEERKTKYQQAEESRRKQKNAEESKRK